MKLRCCRRLLAGGLRAAGGSRLGLCLPQGGATAGFLCGGRARKAEREIDRADTAVDVHLYFPDS